MSNEELVKLIQEGHAERLIDLWEGVKRFVELRAYNRTKKDKQAYYDDIIQECYISMVEAAKHYQAGNMAFMSYYASYYIPNAIKRALYGGCNVKDTEEPLNNSISIYSTIKNTDDTTNTIEAILPDPQSQEETTRWEEADERSNINRILWRGIDSIKEPDIKEIVSFHFLNDTTLKEGYETLNYGYNYSYYLTRYRTGLKTLKQYLLFKVSHLEREASGLQAYIDSMTRTHKYYAGSLGKFKHTFTSNTEEIALKHIEKETEAKAINVLIENIERKRAAISSSATEG